MQLIFVPFWAAAQIGFAYLFFAAFLARTRPMDECVRVLALAWIVTAVFGFFGIPGVHGYLVYLLMAVILLIMLFDERSGRGLGLIIPALLISFLTDSAFLSFAANADGLLYFACISIGKALPVASVLLMRLMHLLPRQMEHAEADLDALLLRQHMALQKESMDALEQNYRMQRKSTHEFEHHLQVLGDLLKQDEIAAARDYLDKLKKNRSMHMMSINSHHPVVDVILNQKYQMAQESGIKVQVQVNDLSRLSIPTDSLAVVLTNLWDNAIEACRRIDGYSEIFCDILYEDGLYLSIRNTSNPVMSKGGTIPTSKPDSLSHGFGLMSVSHVLDQLRAEYTFRYADGWFHFVAEIED